ncbi:MAG: fibronectin type III domain-containing protein [Anaerolineales bacterium]|nr:fibronectin type III domain-containing protein [Anaerolineales bacterium]
MKKLLIITFILIILVTATACGRRRVRALATALAPQAPVVAQPAGAEPLTGGAVLFRDDFQDGQPDGWQTTGAWYVNQQGDVYTFGATGQGAVWVPEGNTWQDYILRTVVMVNSGTLALNFRLTRNGRYLLTIREDGVYLSKELPGADATTLGRAAAPSLGVSHWVVIGGERGHIQVYIDRVIVLDYTDPAPLLQGTIGFGTLDGSQAAVDDVLVTRLTGSLPVASVAPPVLSGGQAPQAVGPPLVNLPPVVELPPQEEERGEEEGEQEQPPEEEVGPQVSDLVVTNVTVSNMTPNVNEAVNVSATILNQGPAPARNFQWVIIPTYDPAGPNNPAGSEVVPLLNAGDDMFVEARVTYPDAGTYTVRVIDDVTGNVNDPSPGEYFERQVVVGGGQVIAPPSPINCIATATSDSVTVRWFFVNDPPRDGFHIYQAITSLEGTAGPTDTSFTVGNLQPNVQYHFDVRAFNSAGESAADSCFVDVTTAP